MEAHLSHCLVSSLYAYILTEPPHSVEFSNSTGANIVCRAEGSPPPSVSWVLADGSGVGNVPNLREVTLDGTLTFPPFRAEDYRQDVHSVDYRCVVTNPVGVVLSRLVHVKAVMNPVYDLQVYDTYAIKGSSAVLRCSVSSLMTSVVNVTAWIKDSAFKIESSPTPDGKYAILPNGELYIRDVDHNDAQTSYRCQVRHRFTGETRQSTTAGTLFVTEPQGNVAPKMFESDSKLTALEGESVILPCAAQGFPLPEYTWFLQGRDGQLISIYLGERFTQISSILIIKSVMVSDTGIYVCRAENNVDIDQTEVSLDVSSPLKATLIPAVQILEIGSSLKLQCKVSGWPVSTIEWVKDGRSLVSSLHLLVANDTVHIDYVRPDHKGMYQCFASNNYDMVQASTALFMGDRLPQLLEGFQEHTLQIGDSVSIKCSFKGNPIPGVTWRLDNTPLPETHRYMVELQTDDGGLYTCEAANKAGKTSHWARLNIYGRPAVRSMGKISATSGGNVYLNCAYYGYPIDKILWKKGPAELPVNLRQDILPNGTLVISNVQRASDSGRYTCVASNKDGDSASQSLDLAVLVAPNIIPFSFQAEHLYAGVIARISCVVYQGDAPIQLLWLKDGQPFEDSLQVEVKTIDDYSSILTIPEVKPIHSGDYTCVAKNLAATVNYTAPLTVNVQAYWMVEPNDTSSFLGGSVHLHCLAGGHPQPLITWLKVQGTFPRGKKKKLGEGDDYTIFVNGTLYISHVDDQHNGYYFCEAQNGIGQGLSKVVRLIVHRPPKFTNPLQRRIIQKGDAIKLECDPKGDRPIQVTWIVNENKVHRKDARYKLRETHSDEKFASELSVDAALRTDSGSYVCAARNVYGSADAIFEVTVQEPPDSPSHIEINDVLNRTLTLMWVAPYDGNNPLKRYVIQYKQAEEQWLDDGKNISVDPTRSKVVITGLQPASDYEFRLFAINDRGASEASDVVQASMAEEAPSGAPEEVEVEAADGTTVNVFWKPPSKEHWNGNIRGYYVGYRVAGSGDEYIFHQHDVPEGFTDRLSLVLTELQKFIQYAIVVQAFNGEGRGPLTEEIIIMTAEDVPSKPPEEVRCSVLNSYSINVTWQPPPDESINGILRGFKKYTNYSIQVLAYTKKGNGVKSEAIMCTTMEDVPNAPADIKALPSSPDSVLLTWKPPLNTNGQITKYIVYAKNVDNESEEKIIHVAKGDITSQEVFGLTKENQYRFWVTASTKIGEGPKSEVLIASPGDVNIPAKSASFDEITATAVKSTLTLPCKAVGIPMPDRKWTRRGKAVDKSDRLYVSTDGSLTITNIQEKDAGNYSCKLSNTFGMDQVVYTLIVLAPPSKPNLAVTLVTTTTLDVQWKVGIKGASPIIGYLLHFKKEFGTWQVIDIGAREDGHRLYDLQCGTNYHLYVIAVNKVGQSEQSKTLTLRTKGQVADIPPKEELIEEGSTYITVRLDSWKSATCPILNFVTEYRVRSQNKWYMAPNDIKPDQKRLVIRDLMPATWYVLRMSAFNNAGSSVVEYTFATLTLTGATVTPIEMINDIPAANVLNLLDLKIVVPAACTLFIFAIALILICICARRSSKQKHKKKAETEKRSENNHSRPPLQKRQKKDDVYVDTGFTYFQRNQPTSSGVQRDNKKRQSRLPREYRSEDNLTPYATINLNGSTSMDMTSFGRRGSGSSSPSGNKRPNASGIQPGTRPYSGSLGNISVGSRIQQVPTAPPLSDAYGAVPSVYPRLSSSLSQCAPVPTPRRTHLQNEALQKQGDDNRSPNLYANLLSDVHFRAEPRSRSNGHHQPSTKPICMSGNHAKSAFS
uniref:Down syndrome cell adhesion molecule-like protein Dscam2 n=1 Tax=Strigamia maritima TaxID=126957 RepID=T1JA70_STRMM